jgi:hypothetical protein
MTVAVASHTRFHPREVRVAGMATTSTVVKGLRGIVNTITSQNLNRNLIGTLDLVIPLVSTEASPEMMATSQSQSQSIMKVPVTMAVGMMMDTGSLIVEWYSTNSFGI